MSEENTFKNITAEEFAKLDFSKYTLVDLRESDELIVSGIPSAINIPFSNFYNKLDDIPKDKTVIVFCRIGDWSEQIAEVLFDRGYDVLNLIGGYNAYRALSKNDADEKVEKIETPKSESTETKKEPQLLDVKGLKCPGPIVAVADKLKELNEGDQILVEATEEAFQSDIQVWCKGTGNKLLELKVTPEKITALIEKSSEKGNAEQPSISPHEKTMVVFSGDLDKTIAAFIMANGAAAMGREVTMFFTFWGLNILRKPGRVKVKKDFIGKMFGAMMPKGSKKLGLSKMNMGGMGAKMIRYVMKSKGIKSLEEMMQDALSHGVKIYACQMSMDIMGIKMDELIDGIVPVGVATMLGAAEKSDMTYFI